MRKPLTPRGMGGFRCVPCSRHVVPPEVETTQDAMPDMRPSQVVLEGVFEYTERGRVVQSLEAAKLERWESSESAEETPDVCGGRWLHPVYRRNQAKHDAKLSAYVAPTTMKPDGSAWEEVVLVNEEGERLETEHLIWSHDSDLSAPIGLWPSTVPKAFSEAVDSTRTAVLSGMKSCRRRGLLTSAWTTPPRKSAEHHLCVMSSEQSPRPTKPRAPRSLLA